MACVAVFMNKWALSRKAGEIPVGKYQPIRFSLSVETERADAGQDGRTRMAKSNSQARAETGEKLMFPVQLTTNRVGNLTRFVYTRLKGPTIHTYNTCVH